MNIHYFDKFEVTELSYYDYKSLVKNLFTDDIKTIDKIFKNLLKTQVKQQNLKLNEKFKLLLFIRSLTLGEEFTLIQDEKNYFLNVNTILEKIDESEIKIESGDLITVNNSNNFLVENIIEDLLENITELKLDFKRINLNDFTNEQKNEILNNIDDVNFSKILKVYKENLSKKNINILNNEINFHNGQVLYFLKTIFNNDLQNLYDLEYFLIKNLNLNSYDFKNYSLTELKILVNKFLEEMSKEENNNTGVPINKG